MANIFHLATIPAKKEQENPQELFIVARGKMLDKLQSAKQDTAYENGYQAGWNAAIDYAQTVLRNGKMG